MEQKSIVWNRLSAHLLSGNPCIGGGLNKTIYVGVVRVRSITCPGRRKGQAERAKEGRLTRWTRGNETPERAVDRKGGLPRPGFSGRKKNVESNHVATGVGLNPLVFCGQKLKSSGGKTRGRESKLIPSHGWRTVPTGDNVL